VDKALSVSRVSVRNVTLELYFSLNVYHSKWFREIDAAIADGTWFENAK